MIKSIGYNQHDIIVDIMALHIPDGIELDPTYSKGNFYKDSRIQEPKYKFDIYPQTKDTVKGDATCLPFDDCAVESIMFDPPFLATTGPSLKEAKGNKINKRFGVYKSEKCLHQFYYEALVEFHRILRKSGVLVVKCQDKVSSGKQYFSHCFMYNIAVQVGFYPKDLFILLAKNRIVADWQRKQKHARKFHCYFWVFEKSSRLIEYL